MCYIFKFVHVNISSYSYSLALSLLIFDLEWQIESANTSLLSETSNDKLISRLAEISEDLVHVVWPVWHLQSHNKLSALIKQWL